MSGDWRGNTLNITCNFLYFNHQVHRDFLITLYFCQHRHDSTTLTATLTGQKQWHTNRCCWVHPLSQRTQKSSAFSHLCPDFSQAKKKTKVCFKLNWHNQTIITFISHLLHRIFQHLLDNVPVAVHCVLYIVQESTWCQFDHALSLIRGNKRRTRSNRQFFIAKIYCSPNMFRALLCPSSGTQEHYTDGCCLWYLVL